MRNKQILLILLLNCVLFVAKAQLTVVPNNSGSSLAQLLAGTGVTVSNVTLNCPVGGAGAFTSNNTNLGIDSGILLTTGRAVNAIGPNNSPNSGTDNMAGGDAVLDSITGSTTYDACVLEFDVTPVGNTLVFKYVFGSEEYPEFVHQGYNDVFAFLITGPLGNPIYHNRNIALVPGTSTPVSIDNVNNITNAQYYVDNTGNHNIQYDGMTTPLYAILNVVPCSTYHFKLAIADVGDGVYDSGVFLEANSLSSQGTTISATVATPGVISTYEGCVSGKFTINLPRPATTNTTLNYTVSGTATNGTDYVTLPGSVNIPAGDSVVTITLQPLADTLTEGPETVVISLTNPCNGALLTSATLIINDVPRVSATANPFGICLGQQAQLQATGGSAYAWSPANLVSNANIRNPTTAPTVTTTYTVTATLGTCVKTASVIVPVSNMILAAQAAPDTQVCPGASVALSAQVSGGKLPYTYRWLPNLHILNPDTNVTTANPYSSTIYTISITDSIGCVVTSSVSVSVIYTPPVTLGPDQYFCPGQGPAVLNPGWSWDSYRWNTGSTTDTIRAAAGTYWVTVTSSIFPGCNIVSDTANVIYYPATHPTLADTGMCPGQILNIAIDHGFTSPRWNTGATANTIQVATDDTIYYTANDANGCAVRSDTVMVTVSALPLVNITASHDTICPGGTAILNSGAAQGLQYLWLPNMYTGITEVVSAPGRYIVRVSQGYCANYDTIRIYQFTHAPIDLIDDTTVCPNNVVAISVVNGRYGAYLWSNSDTTSTIMTNTPGPYSAKVMDGVCYFPTDTFTLYNFSVVNPKAYSDTSVCTGQPIPLAGQSGYFDYQWNNNATGLAIIVTAPGLYSFTANDANGCAVQSDTVRATNRLYPVPVIVASPNAICAGQGQTSLSAGNAAGVIYTWQPGNINADSIPVTQPGLYYVAANKSGCISFDTITIAVADSPVISLPENIVTCCQHVLLDAAPGQNYTYRWSDNSSNTKLDVASTNNTTQVYSVTATNAAGCTATQQTSVFIKCIEPVLTAAPDTIILPDCSLLHIATGYSGNFTYTWAGPNLSYLTGANNYASPSSQANYSVVVTDIESNCTDTTAITVFVIYPDKIAVPDAFTPNDDGKNDLFYPVLISGESQHVTEFRIYNRWGQLVHNGTNAWDGKLNGHDQPSGTFIYYLAVRIPDKDSPGATREVKLDGAVTLLR